MGTSKPLMSYREQSSRHVSQVTVFLHSLLLPMMKIQRLRDTKHQRSTSRGQKITAKSDAFAFGVLLLELLSGKPPSLPPFLASPPHMPDWVKAMRGDGDSFEGNQLGMLVKVASSCSYNILRTTANYVASAEMIHKIKAIVSPADAVDSQTGFS